MEYKDRKTLQEAYQLIFEGKVPECPCATGKKCMKKKCTCKVCVKSKSLKESHESEFSDEKDLNNETIKAGMAILQRFAAEEITSLQAAQEFDELYKGQSRTPPAWAAN